MTGLLRATLISSFIFLAAQPSETAQGSAPQQPLLGHGRGVDHVTILTHDVTAAAQRFADDFGFTVGPSQKWSFGFEARFIAFADGTYIELYGIHDRKIVAEGSEAFALDAPEGVTWATLEVDSAAQAAEALQRLGKPTFGPFKLPSDMNWRYQLTGPQQPFLPGGRIFFVEYSAPPIGRLRTLLPGLREGSDVHANAAQGLRSIWVTASDLDAATASYAAAGLMPGPELDFPALSTRAREIQTPGGTLLILQQRSEGVAGLPSAKAAFSGLSIRVTAIDTVRSRVLKQLRVDLQPYAGLYGRSVMIPASLAHGTAIEFFESPAPAGTGVEVRRGGVPLRSREVGRAGG